MHIRYSNVFCKCLKTKRKQIKVLHFTIHNNPLIHISPDRSVEGARSQRARPLCIAERSECVVLRRSEAATTRCPTASQPCPTMLHQSRRRSCAPPKRKAIQSLRIKKSSQILYFCTKPVIFAWHR